MAVIEQENSPIIKTHFTSLPEKRETRAKYVSSVIFLSLVAVSLVLIFGFILYSNEYDFERSYYMKEGNTTGKYSTRKEILTFPIIFSTALSLFGFLLRTLVDRLSLVAEEYKHKKQRYGGSWTKMIEACFGGVISGLVFPLIILGAISIIILTIAVCFDTSWVEIQYLVCIFSGIGIGYAVMQLFNLNTQSEIHISTILEEKQSFVSNGLAWHYYISYLKHALPVFKKAGSSLKNLNSDKLVLLIPVDCYTDQELKKIDNKIYPVGQKNEENFSFTTYNLKVSNKKRKFAMQYVKAPLNTLREMRWKENEAVRKETLKEQVKLFYRKLYEILKDPPESGCREACIFVTYDYENLDVLKNGGLAKCIIDTVENSYDKMDGRLPGVVVPKRRKPTDDRGKSSNAKKTDLDTSSSSNKTNRKRNQNRNPVHGRIEEMQDLDTVRQGAVQESRAKKR